MYKNIVWNTGPAAMRARARAQRDAGQFNLKLKLKNGPGPKRQAASYKPQASSLKKDTIMN